VLRQVVDGALADRIGAVLREVVEDGTGTAAQLETFHVAGKSGTARAYGAHGGYAVGRYYASFVGYFPADDPQLVIFVKLDSPKGSYYGGATAAPVTRATMEAALATRRTPLDRRALLQAVRRPQRRTVPDAGPAPVGFASLEARWDAAAAPPAAPLVDEVESPADPGRLPTSVALPDVAGLPPRVAVRRLHALGLRVVWDDPGPILGTLPPAGMRVVPGDTVRLRTRKGVR
jgi:membrane peptidoglycan carboxypeptidase